MNRFTTLTVISALLLPGALPAQADSAAPPLPSATLPSELDAVLRAYEREWAARSAEGLARLFTDDGFVLQPDRPPVRGRGAIARAYEGSGGPLASNRRDGFLSGAHDYYTRPAGGPSDLYENATPVERPEVG